MKVENVQEKTTNEFLNKVNTLLQSLNLTCDYNIIEHDDGTRYAEFDMKKCPASIISDVCENYALQMLVEDDKFYLIDVPP